MDWSIFVVQWLHVFLGIFWFGSTLYLNFVVVPAIMGLPAEQRPAISKRISERWVRVIMPVAALVIIVGLLRGIVFGPVQSFSFLFGTAYGITFLVGFLAAVATFFWGLLAISREAKKLETLPTNAKEQIAYDATLNRVKLFALLELIGFFVIFTCMILMRFGY